ncbi:MAG: hypothetical protein V3S46_02275 [Nitrospinota bacterium]
MIFELSGNYPATLDEKGRIHIPSDIKTMLGGNKILRLSDWGACLVAYPEESFKTMSASLLELRKDKEKRKKANRIISQFFLCAIKNGKLLIPQQLREGIKLNKKIQVVGNTDHIQIWNQQDWVKQESEFGKTTIQDDLDELGLM